MHFARYLFGPVALCTVTALAVAAPAVDAPAPALHGTLTNGRPFDLAQLRGKVVLVDFWATWCAPCKLSLPRYADLHKRLAPLGFEVVAVSVDEDADALKRYLAASHMPLPVLHDPGGKFAERFQPAQMPTAYLIGTDGKVAWIHGGCVAGDEAKVEAAARAALAKALK